MEAVAAAIGSRIPSEGSVVDLGAGTGLASQGCVARGRLVVGVDSSEHMLERAVAAGRISRALCADATATGLPTAGFGAVVCANILHLHPHPARVLDEAVRLVRPGGVLVVTTPSPRVSLAAVARAERECGTPWARVARGWMGRVGVALMAPGAVRPAPTAAVVRQVGEAISRHGLSPAAVSELYGVQTLMVMHSPAAP